MAIAPFFFFPCPIRRTWRLLVFYMRILIMLLCSGLFFSIDSVFYYYYYYCYCCYCLFVCLLFVLCFVAGLICVGEITEG